MEQQYKREKEEADFLLEQQRLVSPCDIQVDCVFPVDCCDSLLFQSAIY